MVLDPIPQSLPVHFFGSRPQPPTSPCRVYMFFMIYVCFMRDVMSTCIVVSVGDTHNIYTCVVLNVCVFRGLCLWRHVPLYCRVGGWYTQTHSCVCRVECMCVSWFVFVTSCPLVLSCRWVIHTTHPYVCRVEFMCVSWCMFVTWLICLSWFIYVCFLVCVCFIWLICLSCCMCVSCVFPDLTHSS